MPKDGGISGDLAPVVSPFKHGIISQAFKIARHMLCFGRQPSLPFQVPESLVSEEKMHQVFAGSPELSACRAGSSTAPACHLGDGQLQRPQQPQHLLLFSDS